MSTKNNPFLAEILPIVKDTFGDSCILLSDSYDKRCFGNAGAKFQLGQIVYKLERDRGDIFLSVGGVNGKITHDVGTLESYLKLPPRYSYDVKYQLEFLKQHLSQIEEALYKEGIDAILWELSISISDTMINEIARKAKEKPT